MAERPYSYGFRTFPGHAVPIVQVTPDDGYYVFTYYDICPLSPSQRYLAVTRIPYQNKDAVFGDTADVCVIDLEGPTIRTVYSTRCWGLQVGANINWGATDRYLYTNDVVDRTATCIRIDLESGETTAFGGPMGHVAPDESCFIGIPLEFRNVTQLGYGMPSRDPKNHPRFTPEMATAEGIWRTDIAFNQKRLLVSLASVAEHAPELPPEDGATLYFWHTKFNRVGDRIMAVLRWVFPSGFGGANPMVFTMDAQGGDIHYTPGNPVWGCIGGHPSWAPDGRHIVKNMRVQGVGMQFCRMRYDGTDLTVLADGIAGGGHPSIEPSGRYVVTDEFQRDLIGRRDVKIRFVDTQEHKETILCAMRTIAVNRLRDRALFRRRNQVLRLDGHPVWSRDYQKVYFQAAPCGCRQIFFADVSGFVQSPGSS
jgi:hypothetical protein